MNGIEITVLLLTIGVLSTAVGFYLTKDQPSLKDMEESNKKEITSYPSMRTLTESAKELVKQIDKVAKTPTTQKESQQLAKDIVEIATTPPKKKRKYYPKKK